MAEPNPDAISSLAAHLDGITRVCFSPDGATIFTGGTDCLVRIHKADNPDSEPGFMDDHQEAITSLSCSKTNLVTGCVDNIVRLYSYPRNEFDGFVTRTGGVPVRWVSLDKAGERVAICSDDLLVKIVHVKDNTRVVTLTDNKPVRSATWEPAGKYLTTASCDGKLKVYDTSGLTPLCVKVFEGVLAPSDSESETSCYAQWHPSGAYFAVPARTSDIAIFSRDGWVKQATFTPDGPKVPIGELAWSPNGKYLAASGASNLYIFSTDSRQLVASYSNPGGGITGLAFSPTANLLAYTDLSGAFHRWAAPIPVELPDPYSTEADKAKKLDRLLDDEFGDDGDDADDIEEKGEDLGDDDLFGDDGWIVDDDGTYAKDEGEKKWGTGRTEVVNVTKAQTSFTPGSTEFKNKKRYLAFNMVGVIDSTDQETHNVVNVEFHDKSARRGYHFQDHNKYTMAALGEQGIVYAAPAESDQPSTVYYRPYDSWTSSADWSVNLLPGEDALAVAAGGEASAQDGMGSVVVATTKGYVRFLSAGGVQRYIWRLGEDVVTMAAGRDKVIIVHREGGTSLDGCQNLRYSLVDLDTYDICQEGRVPLPKKTTLTWVGFTSEGAPAMFDSTGLLSVLDRHLRPNQARWVPLLDTTALRKEGRKETYWPVGVTATHFACVLLRGSEKEPWFPRPLIQEVEVHLPLLNMDNQQGKLEESLVRGNITISNLIDSPDPDASLTLKTHEVALDKEMLTLIQAACKADNLQRALDLARLMHNPGTIDAAAKIAAFYHLPGLQERIQGVKAEKEKKKREKKRAGGSGAGGRERDYGYGSPAPGAGASTSKSFTEFAPRAGPRRSFGGVNRDSTPASSGPATTYIPETPGTDDHVDEDREGSPQEAKRRRVDEEAFKPPKKRDEYPFQTSAAPKNPFAKKAQGSNPFAKSSGSKPLDAVKSTSFFDKVDTIEAAPPKPAKTKAKSKAKENATGPGSKQTTLFGAGMTKKPAAKQPVVESPQDEEETQQDEEMEETLGEEDSLITGVLEESNVQETLPNEMEVEE
ncbi:hypothetical protein IAT38_005405 [Cryptococcus sp. DSM 104549]